MFSFQVLNKDGSFVNLDELLTKDYAKNLIECDIDEFCLDEDGNLMLSDDCGNIAYIPREEKFIIRLNVNDVISDIIY